MKALLIPVLLTVGLPLATQAQFWSATTSEEAVLRGLKNSSQPYLMVFAENFQSEIVASVRKLLKEEDVEDLALTLSFQYNSMISAPSANINQSQVNQANQTARNTSSALRRRFGLGQNIQWAVINSSEQVLASGRDLPTGTELVQMLAAKGVQSPVRTLREFLKTNPGHLDARNELLRLQHSNAGRRTREALGLEVEQQAPSAVWSVPQAVPGAFTMSVRYQQSGSGPGDAPAIISTGAQQAPPIPRDKVLDTETDLLIWAGYADSFDRLVTGDDWIASGLSFDVSAAPFEVCSPLVKGLYRRKIVQVETALERAPGSAAIWSVWIRMADVLGDRSILRVVEGLAQLPGSNFFQSWPAEVRKKLTEEARANNKWNFIADSLWSQYERTPPSNFDINVNIGGSGQDERARQMMEQVRDSMFTQQWDTLFEPLLEALVNMNDGRADSIMDALYQRQQRGQWSQSQMHKAIGLANRCNRPDVARRWSAYITENR